jgi:thiosulfate dehydrogenase [quinone] large subunit
MESVQFSEPGITRFLFADSRLAWLWLPLRLYVGYEWLLAGWEKVTSPAWTGSQAGTALSGFVHFSLTKTTGPHPDVAGWYGWFLNNAVLPHAGAFSYAVAFGERLVGVALIVGIFTGIAAFFGAFMNMNYLFAGTLSINPILFLIELILILAWRTAGWWGLDRWALPIVGTPWQRGSVFNKT